LDGADDTGDKVDMLSRVVRRARQVRRRMTGEIMRRAKLIVDDDQKPWAKFERAGEVVEGGAVDPDPDKEPTREPMAEVIKLSTPADDSHALTAVPLIRHWLFAPDRTKVRLRRLEVEVAHRGERFTQLITIGDRVAVPSYGYGVLRTRHQRALFVLQQLWQEQGGRMVRWNGQRRGGVSASSWQIEEMLYGSHGGRQQDMVRQVMQELASIPVKIENYIRPDGTIGTLDVTGLISGAVFAESRKSKGGQQLGFPWVEIGLGPMITRSFELAAVKPINLDVLRSLKRDTAALLYPKLDYYLASNEGVELRLDGLVDKLGMTGKQLQQRSYRRRKFEAALLDLQGKPLSKDGGYEIDARLEPTSDGQDDKLIAERKRT